MTESTDKQAHAFVPVAFTAGLRWAHVEIFGHRQHDGRVSEVERFGTKMCRVEVFCRDGHLVMDPEYGGAALFGVTDLPGGEKQARDRVGINGCPHPDHEAEKAAERARYELPPWESNEGAAEPDDDPVRP